MRGISLRAVLIGLVGVAITCIVVSWGDLVIGTGMGIYQFPPAVVGLFIFLFMANALIKLIAPRWTLSSAEIMIVYCMMLVGAMISSRGLMEMWLPMLVGVNYYANPGGGWPGLFFPHIKKWLVPWDPAGQGQQPAALGFYEGLHHGEPIPWHLWAVPLLSWGVLAVLVIFGYFCLAALLRKQWVESERLSFPLVQLPLEMVQAETARSFLRNPFTWLGFLIPVILYTIIGLSKIYPWVPAIKLDWSLNAYFRARPWIDMYHTPIRLSFAVLGFGYLLPLDVLFSFWFFFLLTRLMDVVASIAGMDLQIMPLFTTHVFIGYQAMGAYVVLAFYLARVSWPHLREVARKAIRNDPTIDDSNEFMSYRMAFWGLIASVLLSIIWLHVAGMSLWLAAIEIVVFMFVISLIMARGVAEGGFMITESTFLPFQMVQIFVPKQMLGANNLVVLSMIDPMFARDMRGLTLTGFLDGLKISDGVKLKRRSLFWAFVVAIIAAIVVAGVFQLVLPYRRGAITMYSYVYHSSPIMGFQQHEAAIGGVGHFDWKAPTFFSLGVIVTIFLTIMRATFYWWPLHPLGYALAPSWSMMVMWSSFFLAWMVKGLILRYGGMRLFRQVRPFFLGMILGGFTMAVVWAIVSFATHLPAPTYIW